ncbi:phosphate ABC transporter ATP-binding protein [Cyanobacterium sp. IPPAS B-1200]|uniref:phosphate ABC transporter ATP-binding protein n=1 Tax=Cyanobacterium sp. IPPAS B-1200 TaxID=1562720 RepID=UPI0008525989|nr:phosphate ABC transporter ATP-binding protein [Cyanobacterium sp. IPPAS B-1200]OEJ79853.1 phosphate ABC transporter ATP-binding protein [Cyanobacterium sp. IPPAS B-1200]
MENLNSIITVQNLSVYHENIPLLLGVNLEIAENKVTGIIGRSGSGKSMLLRCFNRLNDLMEGIRVEGKVYFRNQNIYTSQIQPIQLRRRIGMVFQRPTPFPTSIYENIAMGLKVNGFRQNLDEIVEDSLKRVGLWQEVKNNLRKNAMLLSGGQKQRLCIARAIALQPEVILLDEPCSALDPISTLEIENLIYELKDDYTIIMSAHDLKQIARVCDDVIYLDVRDNQLGQRVGFVLEQNSVEKIFLSPEQSETRNYTRGVMLEVDS